MKQIKINKREFTLINSNEEFYNMLEEEGVPDARKFSRLDIFPCLFSIGFDDDGYPDFDFLTINEMKSAIILLESN